MLNVLFLLPAESDSKIKDGLSDPCATLCACAQSQLQDVCESLLSGNITMENVRMINDNWNQMQQLCTASFVKAKSTETEQTGIRLSYETVQQALNKRLEEFESFCVVHNQLLRLCNDLVANEVMIKAEIRGIMNSVSRY